MTDRWRLLNWRALATLRPTEVAAITGLGLSTVRRKIKIGELRAVEPPGRGRSVLIPVSEVLRLVGEEVPGAAPADPELERLADETLDRLRMGRRRSRRSRHDRP